MEQSADKPDDGDMVMVKCGECEAEVAGPLWLNHIANSHNYLARKYGQTPLDLSDYDQVYNHLYNIWKKVGVLVCNKCSYSRRYVKSYLQHIQKCCDLNIIEKSIDSAVVANDHTEMVKCGVCDEEVAGPQWIDHIAKSHNYLAWKADETLFDLTDEKKVHEHLNYLCKKIGHLVCNKCGARRKYAKSFFHHMDTCDGTGNTTMNSSMNDTLDESVLLDVDKTVDSSAGGASVTCAVCDADVPYHQWVEHSRRQHNYLAWKKGQPPLDLKNEEAVHDYLYMIGKKYNGLKCGKCDLVRKYVKAYQAHVQVCDVVTAPALTDSGELLEVFECAICGEKVPPKLWRNHAMTKHYNIAWIVGGTPIDIKNSFTVEKYLKEYKHRYNKLECLSCGLVRVSYAGFYAHIIQCGKTDEETEVYKELCEICNSKYLCIYKNQHISMHREQLNAKQRKLLQADMKNDQDVEEVTGQRRAAQKAKKVIEKYKSQGAHKCPACDFGADDVNELKEHICEPTSDDDGSAKISSSSSDEDSFDSGAETDHSGTELKAEKKKAKQSDTIAAKVKRVPFNVINMKEYLMESAEDFRNAFLTSDVLYPKWRTCYYEPVADDHLLMYMPLETQSCKVAVNKAHWQTYHQFEAKGEGGVSMFVGGCIQCIAWAPPSLLECGDCPGHFLAVSCHRGADTPRMEVSETYRHTNMLQIWDFGDMQRSLPKFVLGIAHDHGTVWSMDWCPSGARDDVTCEPARLGLLAVACSDGNAYIYTVPYPTNVTSNDNMVLKLKPAAELRFSRGKREICQATSISWSTEKRHPFVVVGYANGMIAFYNLEVESPLLNENRDGTTIIYPFSEERSHNSCITDVSTFPCSDGGVAVCAASPTGAALCVRGSSVRSPLPAVRASFLPHWPAAMLAGNDAIVCNAVNELECWGVGRRLGSMQTCCGCQYCGAAVIFNPPLLRLVNAHPAYGDISKQDVMVIRTKLLDGKATIVKIEDISVKLEPTKYEDAVRSYGLELCVLKGNIKEYLQNVNKNKDQCPERFPLSDVPSMAFCPSATHHRKLAVATHSGIIFLLTV